MTTDRRPPPTGAQGAGSDRRRRADRHASGLIVGRFDPPHLGHSYMIEWAAARAERLVVFVNSSAARDAVPGSLRTQWLADLHPDVDVREVRHALATDFDDPELWERWMALFHAHWPYPAGPDAVFSSDPYVGELAARFGADAVVVDADRSTHPVSASMVRDAPGDHLDHLAPDVRRWVEANWV